MARGFILLTVFLLGVSAGLNIGQWRERLTTERLTSAWTMEMRDRNTVAEDALQILAESKYQIQAAKAEAGRRLRNKEDGRR